MGDHAIFVAADVEDRGRSTRIAGSHICPSESCLRILKVLPTGSASKLEPAFKCSSVASSLRLSLIEVSQLLSADYVHYFTLCEGYCGSSSPAAAPRQSS